MKKQKIYVLISAILVTMMVFTACKSSDKSDSSAQLMGMSAASNANAHDEYTQEVEAISNLQTGEAEAKPEAEVGAGNGKTSTTIPDSSRKLIKKVEMSIETKEYDKLTEALNKKISETNGYVENSEMSGNSYSHSGARNCSITVRVPKAKLDEFVSSVSALGNVTRKTESAQDVTLQYVDVESHKKSLLIEQERLLAMLQKADKLENIITLENRLSDIRYQIESYESQLRTYDNLVDYSTVIIDYHEVEHITPVEKKASMWSRMSTGFKESMSDVGDGLQNLAVAFVSNIPYLVIIAIIVLIVLFFVIRIKKRTDENKQTILEIQAKNSFNTIPLAETKAEEKKE